MRTGDNGLLEQFNIGEPILIPVGTHVELELEGVTAKMKSYCAGALPEDCLIFKYPDAADLGPVNQKLREGNKITVRYADRGNVFAFQSELLGFVTAPVKLIFVAYPVTIVRHSLRKVQRVDYPLFAEVDINNEQFEGLIKDISARGCRLSIVASSSSQALPSIKVEQTLSVRCTLPGMETETVFSGQVKSLHQEDQRVTIGTAFHDIDPEVRDSLARFISSIQKVI